MKQAIFEILGLLIGAAAIGIFFTYRYWKSKFEALSKENNQQKKDIDQLKAQVSTLEKDAETSKAKHQNEIDTLKKEVEAEKKDLKKTQKEKQDNEGSELTELRSQLEKEQKNTKKVEKENEHLKQNIELKDEQLGEQERELEDVSKHLTTHNVSYYKQIDGKRYKAATLAEADESVAGAGDGRISKADAEKVFATISDGHIYTQVEKDTMHYIRENYNWTPEADELFRTKVRSWAAKGHQLDES